MTDQITEQTEIMEEDLLPPLPDGVVLPEPPTPDEEYSSSLDAANAANALSAEDVLREDQANCLQSYVKHLEMVVAKEGFWGPQHDLKPFRDAIAAAQKHLG